MWDIYCDLLAHFEAIQDHQDMQTILAAQADIPVVGDGNEDEQMMLLPLRPPPPRMHAAGSTSHGTRSAVSVSDVAHGVGDPSDSDEEAPHNVWTDESSANSSDEE